MRRRRASTRSAPITRAGHPGARDLRLAHRPRRRAVGRPSWACSVYSSASPATSAARWTTSSCAWSTSSWPSVSSCSPSPSSACSGRPAQHHHRDRRVVVVVYARVVRGQVLDPRARVRQAALAAGTARVIRHVLPNAFAVARVPRSTWRHRHRSPCLSWAGVQPPTPTWGGMLPTAASTSRRRGGLRPSRPGYP